MVINVRVYVGSQNLNIVYVYQNCGYVTLIIWHLFWFYLALPKIIKLNVIVANL